MCFSTPLHHFHPILDPHYQPHLSPWVYLLLLLLSPPSPSLSLRSLCSLYLFSLSLLSVLSLCSLSALSALFTAQSRLDAIAGALHWANATVAGFDRAVTIVIGASDATKVCVL